MVVGDGGEKVLTGGRASAAATFPGHQSDRAGTEDRDEQRAGKGGEKSCSDASLGLGVGERQRAARPAVALRGDTASHQRRAEQRDPCDSTTRPLAAPGSHGLAAWLVGPSSATAYMTAPSTTPAAVPTASVAGATRDRRAVTARMVAT
jgi:hypothetical protein